MPSSSAPAPAKSTVPVLPAPVWASCGAVRASTTGFEVCSASTEGLGLAAVVASTEGDGVTTGAAAGGVDGLGVTVAATVGVEQSVTLMLVLAERETPSGGVDPLAVTEVTPGVAGVSEADAEPVGVADTVCDTAPTVITTLAPGVKPLAVTAVAVPAQVGVADTDGGVAGM
jgi:hypothetical protein